jgi:hypothetical protein
MADAYAALASLRKVLVAQRETHKEVMADGRPEDKHWELVGRCKALEWTIGKVSEQIKSINGDEDGDDKTN